MRLGIAAALAHTTPEEWAEKQKSLGCRAVVFPVDSNEPESKITAYKEAAEKADLMIAEVGIWRNVMCQDPEERKRNLDYSVEQLRLADYVGAKCAVNIAGAFGPRWDGPYKENLTAQSRRKTIDSIRWIIDQANVKNTYFTLEPMPWMIPTGPEDYLKIIDEVERDHFAVHMDIINMINSAERYFNAEQFVDHCADMLGNRIRSCHIKDVHLSEILTFRLEECAPGRGEFPLRHYVTKMLEIDPDMPVILEHLSTDEEYISLLGYLKNLLHIAE